MPSKIQNYINHVAFVIDASGSMARLQDKVVEIFDGQIKHLANRSKELNQETRVSIYLFSYSSSIYCIVYDMDVMRLPSLRGLYETTGNTALIDATCKSIEDLMLTPQIYADHAFLFYTLTDGGENDSRKFSAIDLRRKIESLSENCTFACLVPDENCRTAAIGYGFPANNTQIWSTTNEGLVEAGSVMQRATENFMTARAKGIRSTKNLFQIDAASLTKNVVKTVLTQLKAGEFEIFPVRRDSVIQPFVEGWTHTPYRKGSAYYQLTKPETVQNYKQICVQEKSTGKVYSGTNARQILGLPDHEVKVSPAQHDKFTIFVQSTSVNRKLIGGTQLIVLK